MANSKNFRDVILRILEFILRIEHKTFDQLAAEGRIMRQNFLNDELKKRRITNVEEIWQLGAVKFSNNQIASIKKGLLTGQTIEFTFPQFDPMADYVNFYQVRTSENKYYIYAARDDYSPGDMDGSLMLVELAEKYSTDHLPKEMKYK